ncbi:VWA domain-containing protein [Methylomonas sp. AM2-LC]|uniref:vWA domain-containing protein n=1 Tax=Methylomonas sp. AM2-LC TaxID=3153301 RepID=UPI003262F1AA
MTDEWEDLKHLLRQTPDIKPNPAAKKAAINAALSQFEKNNSRLTQGISKSNRLKDTAFMVGHFIFGRTQMKKYQILLVGAFCALFVVWLTNPLQQASETLLLDMKPDAQPVISKLEEPDSELSKKLPESTPIVAAKEKSVNQNTPEFSRALITPLNTIRSSAPNITNMPRMQMADAISPYNQPSQGGDKFKASTPNPIKLTKQEPVSTFSIDVDTASYSFVRNALNQNVLPQRNAVRVEELINYFPYAYSPAQQANEPFKAQVSVFPSPWNSNNKLLHIGIKGYELPVQAKPKANLVFLIDTSGSMNEANKLPLVKNALKLLLDSLSAEDSVAIVTYAGNAGVALEPTHVKDKNKIISIIDNLGAMGSTAGAEGIRQAYQLAKQNFDPKGVNRVLLATDGDFNVGISDENELKSFIEHERASGVSLSVLGFGTGNYNDSLMQTLAQNGNGNAAYIDTLNEARKVLVTEASSTLFTIAKDVKIQVEFNPAQIAEYRLIGYETRQLKTEDFNNDKVDAGDIGSGHTVTALYEITPVNSQSKAIDELRYAPQNAKPEMSKITDEYGFIKIRYKLPNSDKSSLITTPITASQESKSITGVAQDARFATAVAAFGQLLRGDPYLQNYSYDDVIALADAAKGDDHFGYRAEFVNLVRMAKNAPALPVLNQ